MSTIDVKSSEHQIKAAVGYKVYQCKDCYGFFFIPNDRKTKVEKAAPNHTWDRNNSSQLRHLTKEDREQRTRKSFYPLPSTTLKILKALTEESNLNVTEITKKTGLSSRTINKALKKLTVEKVLNFQWNGKNKRFKVDIKECSNFLLNKENYWRYMSERDLQFFIKNT
jgi:predicted transcriptional regulator